MLVTLAPVQQSDATEVVATGVAAELITWFLATSGAAITTALVADGVDLSGMSAADVVMLITAKYAIQGASNIYYLTNKETKNQVPLTPPPDPDSTMAKALETILVGNFAVEILDGINGGKTLEGDNAKLAAWLTANFKQSGGTYQLRKVNYDQYGDSYDTWVPASQADVYYACPSNLRDLLLSFINSLRAAIANSQSAAADLHSETIVYQYQKWVNYPDSPRLTTEYTYQAIYKEQYLSYVYYILYLSEAPMYVVGNAIQTTVGSKSMSYYLTGNEWSLNELPRTTGYVRMPASKWTYTFMESNNNIYSDSTLLNVVYVKTTLDNPSSSTYDLSRPIAYDPAFDAGIALEAAAVPTTLPVETDDDGKPYIPNWSSITTADPTKVVTPENIGETTIPETTVDTTADGTEVGILSALWDWLTDILNNMLDIMRKIRDGVLAIPSKLQSILDSILAIPSQLFAFDMAKITSALQTSNAYATFQTKWQVLFDIRDIFADLPQTFDNSVPIFYMPVPEQLQEVFGGPQVKVFDLTLFVEYFTYAKMIIRASLWVSFGMFIFNQFKIRLNVA